MTREEAINTVRKMFRNIYQTDKEKKALEILVPELTEGEDEKMLREIKRYIKEQGNKPTGLPNGTVAVSDMIAWLEKQKEPDYLNKFTKLPHLNSDYEVVDDWAYTPSLSHCDGNWAVCWIHCEDGDVLHECGGYTPAEAIDKAVEWFTYLNKQKEPKPIKMEVYEVGKGTTVCGQDYKCKKDYNVGNCRYIKDAIYHCGRDGYLTDQNGVSWSCSPEWFKEYIQSNTEWAEEEKTRFVSGQFLQCKLSFDEFKEGEHYWLEYVGDDMYVGRSDNVLNQKFHITPRQLYTLFSQQLEEKQKEQKPVDLSEMMVHKEPYVAPIPTPMVADEQKPAEWSEEDEEKLERVDDLLWMLDDYLGDDCSICEERTTRLREEIKNVLCPFLKSLRPQKLDASKLENFDPVDVLKRIKKEWPMAWSIFLLSNNDLNDGCPGITGDPDPAGVWKPSKEQMEALKDAVKLYKETHFERFHDRIVSLYEQLKKLM